MSIQEKSRITLIDAAIKLEEICSNIDSAEEITVEIEKEFNGSLDDLKESVDKRIRYIMYAESQIPALKKERDMWTRKIKSFEYALESVKANTLSLVKAMPTVQFRGTLGHFKVQRNAQPSVIVDEEVLNSDWCKMEFTPNKIQIKEALLEGAVIEGARLEYGEHLKRGIG